MYLIAPKTRPRVALWANLHTDELEVARKVAKVVRHFRNDNRFWPYIRPEPPRHLQPQRYVDDNITFCFGVGGQAGHVEMDLADYLEWRAEQMLADLVWDWHQHTGGPDYAFYGLKSRQSPLAMGVASLVGPDAIVLAEPGHPAAELTIPYVGFDVGPESPALEHLEGWLTEVLDGRVTNKRPEREWLFASNIATRDAQRLDIPEHLPRFHPLEDWVADELRLPKPLHILAAGGFTDSKYWAEVVTPFDMAKVRYNPLHL